MWVNDLLTYIYKVSHSSSLIASFQRCCSYSQSLMNDLCNMYLMQYITDVHTYFSYLFHSVVQLSITWHSANLDLKWHTSRLCTHSHHTMATTGQFTWSRDSKAVIASTCYESYRNSSQWVNKSRFLLLFTPSSNPQLTTAVTTPRI